MKAHSVVALAVVVSVSLSACNKSEDQESSRTGAVNDSVYTALLINHLRDNFDDIHDVSMRFHHLDHRLNGVIGIAMKWEDGRMTFASVAGNETNSQEFADALIANIGKWYIEGLTGPLSIILPLRIKIVGSDDSTFSEKGILTGEITDSDGNPVRGAELHLRSSSNPEDTLANCYSNREGIFVRTLIPVGSWDLECSAPGFDRVLIENIGFEQGDHVRKKITLQKVN
jgi:hypothetical protein